MQRSHGEEDVEGNSGKTKIMICGTGLELLQSSDEYTCAICRTGVGNNSIYCNGCKLWVHKKCSGLQELTPNPAWCMGNAPPPHPPIDGRPQSEVQVGRDKLGVVASFCYLGDMVSAGGVCEDNCHYSCENSLEEVQGATTKSHIPPPLLQDQWPCIQLLHAERHAPCQCNLATDHDRPAEQ